MTEIQKKWMIGELPGISCFLYASGDIIVFNSYSVQENSARKIYCSPLCDTHINSLVEYNEDIWTKIDVYNTKIEYKGNYIVSGEGSMGNEGFVACTDKDDVLIWAYFFDFSNPIIKLEI